MANIAAESLLLASFICHDDIFFQYCEYLDEDDFTHLGLKMIYSCIQSLYCDRNIKQLSKLKIISEAKDLGFSNFMSAIKNGDILDGILKQQVDAGDAADAFIKVKRATLNRRYDNTFSEMHAFLRGEAHQKPLHEVVSHVEQKILTVPDTLQTQDSLVHLPRDAKEMVEKFANDPGRPGLDIGMRIFQSRTGGVANGTVTFIVASTKTGKSQLGLWIALNVAKMQIPVLLVDSELNEQREKVRLLGMYAGVPYDVILTGFWALDDDKLRSNGLDDVEIQRMHEYRSRLQDNILYDKFSRLPITYESISGKGISDVIPIMRRWLLSHVKPDPNSRFPQCLIVYDYLKLANVGELQGTKLQEYQLHGLNLGSLHDFAQHYNVPVITFGQTNREVDDNLDCVAGGKRITENVDSISILKRKTPEELAIDHDGNYMIRVFEARDGMSTHGCHINYQVDPSCWSMKELGISHVNFKEEQKKRLADWKRNRNDDDDDDDDT